MKILAHAPAAWDATSFYRALGPLNALAKNNPTIDVTLLETKASWDSLTKYDLIFVQRPASEYEVKLIKMCHKYGVPVWCDWDDNYFCIPDSNNRKKFYTPYNMDCLRWCIKNADYVTVSTQKIYDDFKSLNESIEIVPNAMDQRLFNINDSEGFQRDNVILWRGSDTHEENLDFFKDKIIELMDATPHFVWAFFGFCPKWAIDHLPSDRIRLYENDGCIEYMHRLLAIRPALVYVCHTDHDFNKSRSHIAWMEGTYAGAVVVMPNTQEWKELPGFHYESKEDFVDVFINGINSIGSEYVGMAKEYLIENFDLAEVNQKRSNIIKHLARNDRPKLPKLQLPEPFTEEEFFNYNKENGWTVENPDWVKGQGKFADMIKDDFKVKSVMEIGCGPGGLMESLIKKGVHCMGIDSNRLNKEFFDKRNPEHTHRFIFDEAQNVVPDKDQFYDMVVSVEVFEHIPDEIDEIILKNWVKNCKFFLFTSTPYHSTPDFDTQWSHVNVKPTDHWIKFFSKNGYRFIQMLTWPTKEAMLFIAG